jgi:putative acetyltransferase
MNITLRHETPADVGAITTLTAAAFLHAEHSSHTEQFIVNALRAAGALTLSLVAEQNGTPIGHASVSPVVLSNGAAGWYGLAPVSVLPASQNRGIGSRLIRQLLAELQERHAAGCVVLGDPNYYGRFGFHHVGPEKVRLPGPVDPRRVLVAGLVDGAFEAASGDVSRAGF